MKEPERLLLGEATEFERELLEAVRGEQPSPELTRRMELALGIGHPAGTMNDPTRGDPSVTPPASAAGQTAAGNLAPTVATKAGYALWLGLGAAGIAGAGLVAAVIGFEPSSPVELDEPVGEHRLPSDEKEPASDPARSDTSAAKGAGERESTTLREEIEMLDAARSALAGGDRDAAQRVLTRYRGRFPHGALSREAELLARGLERGGGAKVEESPSRGAEGRARPR